MCFREKVVSYLHPNLNPQYDYHIVRTKDEKMKNDSHIISPGVWDSVSFRSGRAFTCLPFHPSNPQITESSMTVQSDKGGTGSTQWCISICCKRKSSWNMAATWRAIWKLLGSLTCSTSISGPGILLRAGSTLVWTERCWWNPREHPHKTSQLMDSQTQN